MMKFRSFGVNYRMDKGSSCNTGSGLVDSITNGSEITNNMKTAFRKAEIC